MQQINQRLNEYMTMLSQKFKGKKVLLTGHTGFKGGWLSTWLTKLGAEVCGFSNGIPTDPALFDELGLSSKLRHELGDICDLEKLERLVLDFKPDFVFHFAAQAVVSTSYADPLETLRVNVMGTATVLQALRRASWDCVAVIITSDKAYDNVEWAWGYRETDALGGKDVYSGSKGGAELVFKSYFSSFYGRQRSPVRLATARAGNVIGGGDWATDRIIADCMRAWVNNKPVQIRSPKATRPWQHVLEPLSGYLTLAARMADDWSLSGESFNFGPRAEQNATVLELLSSLAKVWGFQDASKAYAVVDDVPFHEASLLKLNVDKALMLLRWEPNLGYDECVTMTGEWYHNVLRQNVSAWELTNTQIDGYIDAGRKRNRVWAQ